MSVVVIVIIVFAIVCGRTLASKMLIARGMASLRVSLAFAIEGRHQVHIPGGRAFAVGLNDLYV